MSVPSQRLRRFTTALLLMFAAMSPATEFPTLTSSTDLTQCVDAQFVDPLSILCPPGSNIHFRADIGFMVFDPATFDATNLLVAPQAFGTSSVFALRVSETNQGSSRARAWSTASGVIWTTLPPASYDPTSAVLAVFGACPAWETLESYVADRDPWRQTVSFTLVASDQVAGVEAVLSNQLVAVQGGNTNLPWTTNDFTFIAQSASSGGLYGYANVPTNIPVFDVFGGSNLVPTVGGWYLRGRQQRSGNPMTFAFSDEYLSFIALGSTNDVDGDGLTDAREMLLTGTSTTNADSDADGLTDGEEHLQYRTDALNADTDGDGLTDGWEVRNGYSPRAWHNKNALGGNGLPLELLQQLGGSVSDRVVNVAPDQTEVIHRTLSSRRSLPSEAFAGFAQTGAYYRTVAFSTQASWGWSECYPDQILIEGSMSALVTSTFIGQTNCVAHWFTEGLLQAGETNTSSTFDTPPVTNQTIRYCVWNWSATNVLGEEDVTLQGTAQGCVTATSCYGQNVAPECSTSTSALGEVPHVSPSFGPHANADTVRSWSNVSDYAAGAVGSLIWSTPHKAGAEVLLSNPVAATDLLAVVATDVDAANTNAWSLTSWDGSPTWVSDCGTLEACASNDVAAWRSDEANAMARAGYYRLRLLNSEAGVIYRAAAALCFTPENGTDTTYSVSDTFYARGTGGAVDMTPTNGVFVPVPASPGCTVVQPVTVTLPHDLIYCWTDGQADLSSCVHTQLVEGDGLDWSFVTLAGETNASVSQTGVFTFGNFGGRYVVTAASSLLPELADRATITVLRVSFTTNDIYVNWRRNIIFDAREWLVPNVGTSNFLWQSESISGAPLLNNLDGRFSCSSTGGVYRLVVSAVECDGCSSTVLVHIVANETVSDIDNDGDIDMEDEQMVRAGATEIIAPALDDESITVDSDYLQYMELRVGPPLTNAFLKFTFETNRIGIWTDREKNAPVTSGEIVSNIPTALYVQALVAPTSSIRTELVTSMNLNGQEFSSTNVLSICGGVECTNFFEMIDDYLREYRGAGVADYRVYLANVRWAGRSTHQMAAIRFRECDMHVLDATDADCESIHAVVSRCSDSAFIINGTFFDHLGELDRPYTTYGTCIESGSVLSVANRILAKKSDGSMYHINGNYKGWFGINAAGAWASGMPQSSAPYSEPPTNGTIRTAMGGAYVLSPDNTSWRSAFPNCFTFDQAPSQIAGVSSNGIFFVMTSITANFVPIAMTNLCNHLQAAGVRELFALDGGSSYALASTDPRGAMLKTRLAGIRHNAFIRASGYLSGLLNGVNRGDRVPVYLIVKWRSAE